MARQGELWYKGRMLLITAGMLYWGLFIGLVGMGFLIYGKKRPDGPAMITGIILVVYPYFIGSLFWNILVGILVVGAYVFLKTVVRI